MVSDARGRPCHSSPKHINTIARLAAWPHCIGTAGTLNTFMQVRRHVAVAIALSLPGGSKLLPFLYDIAATITGTAPADSSADVASGQHSLVMKARSLVPFLHNYPAWLSSRRRTGANAKQDRVAGDEEVGTLEPGDIEASNDGLPVKEKLDREASACFSIGCVGSGAEHKDALDQRGEVLYETVGGYSVRVPASAVEQELHRIVEQLDHGVGALRQAPVRRALAGEFGRMEQLQHEAFLRMRAVCQLHSWSAAHCPRTAGHRLGQQTVQQAESAGLAEFVCFVIRESRAAIQLVPWLEILRLRVSHVGRTSWLTLGGPDADITYALWTERP